MILTRKYNFVRGGKRYVLKEKGQHQVDSDVRDDNNFRMLDKGNATRWRWIP